MPLVPPDFLRSRLTLPVAILGGGVSGEGARELVQALGADYKVYDVKGMPFTAEAARRHGVVVYSPGFAQEHPWLALARVADCTVLCELDFASLFWRGKILAITGTNGKTTLTEFLTFALNRIGVRAQATGNIGLSFSKLVAQERGGSAGFMAVCEVSSFQSEDLKHFTPEATLWTNFAEDHLERHGNMGTYFAAKWNLVARTVSQHVFIGTSVEEIGSTLGYAFPKNAALSTLAQKPDPDLSGTAFEAYPQYENFLVAKAWWRSARFGELALYASAKAFQLARHRLTKVGQFDGVTYWNDSKATNFHAVEAALTRFKDPVRLIVGGKAKGGDIPAFAGRIAPKLRHAYVIGETRFILASAFEALHAPYTVCTSLDEAVFLASEASVSGDNVLLGPAFASFDMFENYADRGSQFEQLVQQLGAAAHLT